MECYLVTDFNLQNRCSLPAILDDSKLPERCEQLYEQFKDGDRSALMVAIMLCSKCKIVMPDWVCNELTSLPDALESDINQTLDNYFGYEREVTNSMQFDKEKTARENEKEIVMRLVNHRIDRDKQNGKTGSFSTENLKEIANETDFTYGEVEVVYNKFKTTQWLKELHNDSEASYGKEDLKDVLFWGIPKK
jgi:hypothetical protein